MSRPTISNASSSKSKGISEASRVYFILDRSRDLLKIGTSTSPQRRLKALQTANGSKLEMLGHIPGGKMLESILHARYSRLRKEGEWFAAEQEIECEIEALVKEAEPPQGVSRPTSDHRARASVILEMKELALTAAASAENILTTVRRLERRDQ